MRKIVILVILLMLLYGCASTEGLNNISLGMKKAEVIERMGKPTSVSATEGTEYLNYTLIDPISYMYNSYYVCIQNDKVASYGRLGDFNSAKDPTQVVKIISDAKSSEKIDIRANSEGIEEKLETLNKLLTGGLITNSEFDEQKKKLLNDYTSKQN